MDGSSGTFSAVTVVVYQKVYAITASLCFLPCENAKLDNIIVNLDRTSSM